MDPVFRNWFPVFILGVFPSSMIPALLRHSSNSLENDEHWYVRYLFSWVLCQLKSAYLEGWVTDTKTKDTEKDILKLY